MKKTKLILLTIMMVLVLYCGAVIFVTKPNSFAYSAVFGDNATVPSKTTQQTAVTESIDTEALLAELSDTAANEAKTVANDVASKSAETIRKAIEDSLPAMIDEAVKNAMADLDINEQVKKAVSSEFAGQQSDLASMIYEKYSALLVDRVTEQILSALTAPEPVVEQPSEPEVVEEETHKAITPEEYEAQRQEIRNSEINDLLEKLGE